MGGEYEIKSVISVAKVALRCVEGRPSSRPSVSEVVAEIREAIMHQNGSASPLPIGEEIDTEYGDLHGNPVRSRVDSGGQKNMEWGDNSSNLPQVGR